MSKKKKQFRCRLKNILLKDGGTYLYELPIEPRDEEARAVLDDSLNQIKSDDDFEVSGFVMIAWDFNSKPLGSYFISENSPISTNLLPPFVQSVINDINVTAIIYDED